MKLKKRIVALSAAVMMAMTSMTAIGASAYNLHYSQGAPSSDNKLSDNSYVGNYFDQLSHVYVHSNTFTRLLAGGTVRAENKNTGYSVTVSAANRTYTITTNTYLSGAMIHNYYELRNYVESKSMTATGYDSYD